LSEVQETAERTLPANMSTSFEGTAKAFQSSLKNLTLLLTVAIMVVCIVLGVLYESYIHPLTIFPTSVCRRRARYDSDHFPRRPEHLFVRRLMMLIELLKKNAIMQIDFALEAERKEASLRPKRFMKLPDPVPADHDDHYGGDAGRDSDFDRYGAGGESRRPLGLAW